MKLNIPCICEHIAVHLEHCIEVVGGYKYLYEDDSEVLDYQHIVWVYNIFLEQWRRYQIPKNKQVPYHLTGACGAVIDEDIYTRLEEAFLRPISYGD